MLEDHVKGIGKVAAHDTRMEVQGGKICRDRKQIYVLLVIALETTVIRGRGKN